MSDAYWCGKRVIDMDRAELEKAFFNLWDMRHCVANAPSKRRYFGPIRIWTTCLLLLLSQGAHTAFAGMPFHENTYHQSAYSGEGPHGIKARTYELTVFLWVMAGIIFFGVMAVAVLWSWLNKRR